MKMLKKLATAICSLWRPDPGDCYFGGCPECRSDKHVLYCNLRKNVWFYCGKHKLCWWGGYGLFSSWAHETPEDWERNEKMLSEMLVVKPAWFPPEVVQERNANAATLAAVTDGDNIPF
ncbi:MAG: hypothetical protein KY475_23310 [Planctomycetes bacterium]|nr:hypothetical protein [Planctomycetota bacterium]